MNREVLPPRRRCETHAIVHRYENWSVSIGRFSDGRLAEVFISSPKPTSDTAYVAQDGAVLISLALQFGVPLATMRGAITRLTGGDAATIIGAALDLLSSGPDAPEGMPAERDPPPPALDGGSQIAPEDVLA